MMSLLYKLTGGRPMKLVIPNYFVDLVSNEPVGLYVDKFERHWMAAGPYDLFRVRSSTDLPKK